MANRDPKYSRMARREEQEEQAKRNRHRPKSLVKKTFLGLMALICLAVILGATTFFVYAAKAPALSQERLQSAGSTIIYDSNNKRITTLGVENRDYVNSKDIPQGLKDAVVSIEDRRFYKNHGVDPVRIIGAAIANIRGGAAAGLQGGSTLDQQLIKLSFFSTKRSDQTFKRKAQEAWLALQLDRHYTKDQILTFYVNKVFMGYGRYGMETASHFYYGKSLKQLDLAQTAVIAGIPNAPTDYNPYSNPKLATTRRNEVLDAMVANKKISSAQAAKAKQEPITQGLKKMRASSSLQTTSYKAKIADPYLKQVIADAKSKGYNPYNGSLKIYTNLNMDYQKKLYNLVNDNTEVTFPDSSMQVAATIVDPNNGNVVAMLGGRKNNNVTFGLNRAVQTDRTNGSTAKPLMDYGPAIEYLNWATYHPIKDTSYVYPGTDTSLYDFDHAYKGTMTMREALIQSRNIPAIRALQAVGITKAQNFISKMGFDYKKTLEFQNGIGLPSSTLQNAAAYAAFANGGIYHKPSYIRSIVTADGEKKTYSSQGTQVMKSSTAYMITDMLKQVISKGTGTSAQIGGIYQAGKTGTNAYPSDVADQFPSNADMDSWFNGYTKQYSMSVWTGYDHQYKPGNYLTPDTDKISMYIYRAMMEYMMQDKTSTDWDKPSDVFVKYIHGVRQLYLAGSAPAPASVTEPKKSSSVSAAENNDDDEQAPQEKHPAAKKSSTDDDDQDDNEKSSSHKQSSSALDSSSSSAKQNSSVQKQSSSAPASKGNNQNNQNNNQAQQKKPAQTKQAPANNNNGQKNK